MNDISMILLCYSSILDANSLRHLVLISEALLSMTGRITMLGISRWTETGGSYRTLQRFFTKTINWRLLNWKLFKDFVFDEDDVILIAGDTTTVTKAGKETYGLGRYFHSIYNRAVPSISFLNLSLISVKQHRAYPIIVKQVIKPEKKADTQEEKKPESKKRGRPKGSKNKNHDIKLSRFNRWLQRLLKVLLGLIEGTCKPKYFLYDNALGNAEGVAVVTPLDLHLISKLKCNSVLWFPYKGEYQGRGAPRKYGERVDYKNLPDEYLKSSEIDDGIMTKIYQMKVRHKLFPKPLNVVIIQKTNLKAQKTGQVILFSTDLQLAWNLLIEYYSLRYQIEFTFRDAKQYWGLEDFMNIGKKQVHNMANLALFMVNLTYALRQQPNYQAMSVLDLKAWFRAGKFVRETLKHFPESADDNFISQIIHESARFGRIHSPETIS